MRQEIQLPEVSRLAEIGSGPYSTLVLADCEDDMWLANVRFHQPPEPGLTFSFQGTVWQLTWATRAGCTAAPLIM